MKNSHRNIFLLFGIIAIIIMLLTFDMDYRELWANMSRAGYWFFAVVGIWCVIYLFNALSWFYIVRDGKRPSPVPFWRIYKLSISGFALNYATPFGLMGGEPYRIMELTPFLGASRATSSVILYVMMHIFSHICFWLTSIVLYLIIYTPTLLMALFLALTSAVLLLLVFFFVAGYRNGMVVKTFHLLGHIPFISKWSGSFYQSHHEALHRIDSQIASLHRQRKTTFYASFLCEFTARCLTSVEIFFILKILTPEVSFFDCILIMAFTSLFANIFFFSPLQLGAREGGFALAVSGLHLSGAFGVYTGLISRIREFIWIVIGVILMKIGNIPHRQPDIKGLLFDYGGTLDTGGRHWADVIWEAWQHARVPVSREQFQEAYIHTEQYLADHSVIQPQDTFKQLLRKKIQLQTRYLQQDDLYTEVIVAYCYDYAQRETTKSRQVLLQFKGRLPMAVVSNFYGNIHTVLHEFSMDNLFDAVIDSTIAGIRKPSPDIWQIGLDALRLSPGEACVIGDSLIADINPARHLGCHTVWFKRTGNTPSQKEETADHTINTLGDLTFLFPDFCQHRP